jgi:opacity protein-like surface antigen
MKSFEILPHKSPVLFFLCCLLPLLSTPTFAVNGHAYLSGNAGASMQTLGNDTPNINYYNGLLNDAYPAHSKNATIAEFGLQGGYEFTLWNLSNSTVELLFDPVLAVGLGVYTGSTNYSYHGDLVETPLDDPAITLYGYRFHTQNTRLMAEAQMTWKIDNIAPFINIGIGQAWVKTNKYLERTINNIDYPPLPPFQSRTNANFAFQAGLGLGYEFNFLKDMCVFKHERISLGYRYVNLGNASFGIRGTAYPYKLNLGNLSNNDIYVAYTHLF